MKAYTFHRGRISEGIATTEHPRFGTVVALGEAGRGRHQELMALDRNAPATVVDGRVVMARPKTVQPRHGGRAFTLLETAPGEADAFLARVCTQWAYTRGTRGEVSIVCGQPERLAEGYGAHGQAGRVGGWEDSLWVMRPGDELQVEPEGGRKSIPYRIWVEQDGSLQCDTVKNRDLDLAMRGE